MNFGENYLINIDNPESLLDQKVLMKHMPSGEVHEGVVIDYIGVDLIVQMCERAEIYIDDDEGIIDTRFDPWEFLTIVV